jgi:hypothetical protein
MKMKKESGFYGMGESVLKEIFLLGKGAEKASLLLAKIKGDLLIERH